MKVLPLLVLQLQIITFDGPFELDSQTFGDMIASRWRIWASLYGCGGCSSEERGVENVRIP